MIHKKYEITVKGKDRSTRFLNHLAASGVKTMAVSEMDSGIRFHTDKKGVLYIRKSRRSFKVKVSIARAEERSLERRLFSSYRFLIACLVPLVASLFLWQITIETEAPEVVERIENKLGKASIKNYKMLSSIPDEGEIRRALMQDDPSLSWVRFVRSGSKLTIIPMHSPKLNDTVEKEGPLSDLVARTGGVVTRFQLSRGERIARLHETVKKGDLLATGTLEQGSKTIIVGAEGSVYADYWSEYSFEIPKSIDYHLLGEESVTINWRNPIVWKQGSDMPSFRSFIQTENHRSDRVGKLELTEGMEETVILPLIKYKIMSESQSDLIIKDENILHLTFENDTVVGTILFLMNENIAIKRPISQGD